MFLKNRRKKKRNQIKVDFVVSKMSLQFWKYIWKRQETKKQLSNAYVVSQAEKKKAKT